MTPQNNKSAVSIPEVSESHPHLLLVSEWEESPFDDPPTKSELLHLARSFLSFDPFEPLSDDESKREDRVTWCGRGAVAEWTGANTRTARMLCDRWECASCSDRKIEPWRDGLEPILFADVSHVFAVIARASDKQAVYDRVKTSAKRWIRFEYVGVLHVWFADVLPPDSTPGEVLCIESSAAFDFAMETLLAPQRCSRKPRAKQRCSWELAPEPKKGKSSRVRLGCLGGDIRHRASEIHEEMLCERLGLTRSELDGAPVDVVKAAWPEAKEQARLEAIEQRTNRLRDFGDSQRTPPKSRSKGRTT
jgi:hypothetical protein